MKLTSAVLLCLVAGSAAAQSTNPRPLQRATDENLALLMTRSYDRLDQAAEEARTKELLLTDGQPRLHAIYAGVAGCGCGNQLNDELWLVRKQRLDEWMQRTPGSTTARLAQAAFPVKYAWMARGGGFAHTVSPEGWKLFAERMEQGRKALEALDAKIKDDPGWYEMMLEVAVSQGWPRDRYEALFSAAVGKHPYYTPFYFARMTYYSPKWHGSAEDTQRVVEDAVARTRSRWGETLYARLNWAMSDHQMFQSGRTDWPRMKQGFERLVNEHPDPWNLHNFAKFACLASDFQTLKTLLPKVTPEPIVAAWENNPSYYKMCTNVASKLR